MSDNAGRLLVRAGLITQAQLVSATESQRRGGGTLGLHLVAAGAIDEERLAEFYRHRLMVPRVGAVELSRVRPEVAARVPADMAAEFRVVPVEVDRDGNLTLAMADPSDTHAVDEVAFFTGAFIVRAVATESDVARTLAQLYAGAAARPAAPSPSFQTVPAAAAPGPRPPSYSPLPAPASVAAPSPRVPGAPAGVDELATTQPIPREVLEQAAQNLQQRDAPQPIGGETTEPVLLLTKVKKPKNAPAPDLDLPPRGEASGTPLESALSGLDRGAEALGAPAEPLLLSTPKRRARRRTLVGLTSAEDPTAEAPVEARATTPPPPSTTDDAFPYGRTDTTAPRIRLPTPPAGTVGYATDFGDDPTPLPRAPVVPVIDQPSQVVRIPEPPPERAPLRTPVPASAQGGSLAAPPPALPTADLAAQATIVALRAARDRDRIAEVLLEHASALCARTVLFTIRKGFLAGASGRGAGVRIDVLRAISLPLEEASVFRDVVASRLPYRGPLDQVGWAFVRLALGKVPEEALLVPISVRDKVVAVLYGDELGAGFADGSLEPVIREASQAYERLLLDAKNARE